MPIFCITANFGRFSLILYGDGFAYLPRHVHPAEVSSAAPIRPLSQRLHGRDRLHLQLLQSFTDDTYHLQKRLCGLQAFLQLTQSRWQAQRVIRRLPYLRVRQICWPPPSGAFLRPHRVLLQHGIDIPEACLHPVIGGHTRHTNQSFARLGARLLVLGHFGSVSPGAVMWLQAASQLLRPVELQRHRLRSPSRCRLCTNNSPRIGTLLPLTQIRAVPACNTKKTGTTLQEFLRFRSLKQSERLQTSVKRRSTKNVQVNVGIMSVHDKILKKERGKTLPLVISSESYAQQLLQAAEAKLKTFHHLPNISYVILHSDGLEVDKVPGSEESFTIQSFKDAIGKPFNRLTFFICAEKDYKTLSQGDETDNKVIIHPRWSMNRDNLEDTLPLCHSSPREESKPDQQKISVPISEKQLDKCTTETSTSSSSLTGSQCYSNYVDFYSPIVIEDKESSSEEESENIVSIKDPSVDVKAILSDLAMQILPNKVSRFNINRGDLWEGALHGFKRQSYDPTYTMLVKFTDDYGVNEDGIDAGGPKREFLQLLMCHIKGHSLLEGKENETFLRCDSTGLAKDEYYIIGRVIAVSLVHGGPAPHFFSRHFVEYICGKTDVSPSIEDVTDPDIQNVLQEIVSSTSLSILRDIMAKHSTVLLLAGCLHSIKDIGERESVVQDFLKWYLFSRNAACIERFKDGLSTLDVLEKILESPSAFEPYLCFSTQNLSSELIESIFRVEFSVAGSNKRREEGRIASYWADYLLDIEGNISSTDPTLEDIVMFATGLKMIPPLGFEPRPTIKFLHDNSPFPTANTCSNTLCLPLHLSYDSFKFHISFEILNSPGFGLY